MRTGIIFMLLALLTACSDEKKETNTNTIKAGATETRTIKREVNVKAFSRGQKLFQKNCAVCHGKHAEGTKNWRSSDEDGTFPPPPLNGTAHTWHHSTSVLVDTIKNGTAKIGGSMPAWKDKLTDNEILDILVWVKAQWPDEIYAVWYKNYHQEK